MPAKRVPPNAIPEVEAFTQIRERIDQFKAQHADIFEEFEELAHQHNTALEQADKAVRGKQVSCGPFDGYQDNNQFYADKLYELVGREEFLRLGGKIETNTEYKVDRTKLKSMIDAGKLSQDLVDEVFKPGFKYRKPDPLNV